jgi:Transglycosylase SLT domain
MTGNVTQGVIDLVDLARAERADEKSRQAAVARVRRMLPPVVAFAAGALCGALGMVSISFWRYGLPPCCYCGKGLRYGNRRLLNLEKRIFMRHYNVTPFSAFRSMSRIFCALLISFGVLANVYAQDSESVGAPLNRAADTSAALAVLYVASDALAASQPAASDAAAGQVHRISSMLVAKFGLARTKAEQIAKAVLLSASKYSLSPALVLAVISIESRFRENARGSHGATGLMQVVPAAHRRLARNVDLTEVAANIEAGSAILHGYIESAQGDVAAALKSYGGSTAYARTVSLRAQDFEPSVAASDAGEAAGATSAR